MPKGSKTIFHVYWHGKLNRKQLCCINSYLKTQDLSNTELWVWLDFLTYNKSFSIVPKHKNIILKKYVPDIEAKNTPFRNYTFKSNKILKI